MQDKYAGDIGDFGKFIILRALRRTDGPPLRLGINWYRTTRPERSSNDGRHVSYLDPSHPNSERFRRCSPEVYSALARIVRGTRSVCALEASALLPKGTLLYSSPVPCGAARHHARLAEREAWMEESLSCLRGADVRFLDPDNGIASSTLQKTRARAMKYAFLDELQRNYADANMLIVYHHRDRSPAMGYRQKFLEARSGIDPSAQMRVLRFKRASVRDYLFLYKEGVSSIVDHLFNTMIASPFDFLFEELPLG